MIVTAKCDFLHDRLGNKKKGQQFEVNDAQLRQLQKFGWVEVPVDLYHTKVTTDHPLLGRGEMEQSSVSQAAQASPQTTFQQSRRGKKRERTDSSL